MVSMLSEKEYRTVVVIDNDECIGSWSLASAIHNLVVSYVHKYTGISVSDCTNILKSSLIKYYFNNGGARPGTKNMLNLLKLYKDIGIVDKVSMFTSAGNEGDWVIFLKDCLEEYAGVYGLYDIVLHKYNTTSKVSMNGATIKCMDLVLTKLGYQEEKTSIIVFDDKPQNIRGSGYRIAVTPYRHIIDDTHLNDMIDDLIEKLQVIYLPIEGNKTYEPNFIKKMIKDVIFVDKDGRKKDVYDNLHIHNCPIDQLNDNNLIEQSVKAFIDHITPSPLLKNIVESPIKLPHPNLMKKYMSI